MYQGGPWVQGNAPAVGPSTPTLKWFLPGNFEQPALAADGTVYAVEHTAHALDAISSSGALLWSYVVDDLAGGEDFIGTPALRPDGTIVIGSRSDANDSHLYILNSDGTLAQNLSYNGTAPTDGTLTSGSPLVGANGLTYVGTAGLLGAQLFAVDSSDQISWVTVGESFAPTTTSPVADDGTVFMVNANDDMLDATGPDGGTLWAIPFTGQQLMDEDNSYGATLGTDGTIYMFEFFAFEMAAFTPQGQLLWTLPVGQTLACHEISIGPDGTIFYLDNVKGLVAVDPSGTVKWQAQLISGAEDLTPPVIDGAGNIYVDMPLQTFNGVGPAPDAGFGLQAYLPDGTPSWRFEPDIGFNSSPAIGPDGTLYVASSSNLGGFSALYLVSPGPTNGLYAIGQ